MNVVERLANALEPRLSRRSFMVRSAFAGSALSVGGVGFLTRPGGAYSTICSCGDAACGCGSTCCAGYTEFCCVINGGYNYCPSDTIMGGWWKADGSQYCDGPRYYMDCNGKCSCTSGCGDGYQFCDTGCDGLTCGCAEGSCDNYLEGCFQFRYGQCNQDVSCIGRIKCRVVTCVPPWEIDPTCTTTIAVDDGTANQDAACLTPGPTPPPPPKPVCGSARTRCEVVGIAGSHDSRGYALVTAYGRAFCFGDDHYEGEVHRSLAEPVVGIVTCPGGGYWFVTRAGRVMAWGGATWHGDAYGKVGHPVVAMAAHPSGNGYWLVTAAGRVFSYGAAAPHGEALADHLVHPVVAMAATRTGRGYHLVTSAGRVLAYGDARWYGGTEKETLRAPIVALAPGPDGDGYWLAAADGAVFSYGRARYEGGANRPPLAYPVVGMAATRSGRGYWLVTSEGAVYDFGSAGNHGSPLEAHA